MDKVDDPSPAPGPTSPGPDDRDARSEPRANAESRPTSIEGMAVLRLIRPVAVLAVLATLVGRMAAPAAVGLAVGMDRQIHVLGLAGAILSQLFAVAAVFLTISLIFATAWSRAPYALRVGAIVAGGFVLLLVLGATVRRLPGLSSALIGVGASAIALGAAWDARRAPFARPVALALGLVALGALIRLIGVALALRAIDGASRLGAPARGVATAAFVVEGLAILIAMVSLTPRPTRELSPQGADPPGPSAPPPGDADGSSRPALASPLTVLALALAFLATRQALGAGADDASLVDVLLRRALDRLLLRPPPYVPLGVQLFAAALAMIIALLALVPRRALPALSGALALILVARSAPDVPLGALALVIAGFSVALAARDDRGVWATLLAGKPPGRADRL